MPQVPILLGGPEITFNPEPYLADGLCDYILRGEGEIAFTKLCDALLEGKDIPDGFGIAYFDKAARKVVLPEPVVCENLAELASPYTPDYLQSCPDGSRIWNRRAAARFPARSACRARAAACGRFRWNLSSARSFFFGAAV